MSILGRFRLLRGRAFPSEGSTESVQVAADQENKREPGSGIEGDRGTSSLHRGLSIQSRVSNVLAVGLMALLGAGLLGWYYTHTFAKRSRTREVAQAVSREAAQGEMSLPPLGAIEAPVVERLIGPRPPEPFPAGSTPDDFRPTYAQSTPAIYANGGAVQTPQQVALERRLSGPAFIHASEPRSGRQGRTSGALQEHPIEGGTLTHGSDLDELPASYPAQGVPAETMSADTLAELMRPSVTPAAQARVLPTQQLLLAKGSFLDCTLETAIDSTLPGMTTCVTATDTFGVDGSVVLLERGTKLVGETRGEVRQGSSRVYVLWTEARTPTGVVVPLASPGTDELGRAGVPGKVDRNFWERFGAAILVSVIDGAIQGAVQRSNDGGTVIYSPSASQNIMTEVLKSTISIPPTVRKENGDRIAILVARDLDFRPVYELRTNTTNR